MSDPLPTVPPLRFEHIYDIVFSTNVTPKGQPNTFAELPFAQIRAQLTARQAEGWELVQQELFNPTTLGGLAMLPDKFSTSPAVTFGVILTFKRSNADAQGAVLRQLAVAVQEKLNEITNYKASVTTAIKNAVDSLREDVRKAIQGPITQAVKDEIEQRFAAIEAEIEALREQ